MRVIRACHPEVPLLDLGGHGQGGRAGGGAAVPLLPVALAPASPACPEGRPGEQEPGHVRGGRDGRRALPVSCRGD